MSEDRGLIEKTDELVETVERAGLLLAPLALAFWRMRGAFEREMGVSAGTWLILKMLVREDGISQGAVSQAFNVDPSRITRLAQRLEREGLLHRARDPEDNRVVRMYVTEAGRELLERLGEHRERFEDRVCAALSPEEHEELKRLLGVLAEAMKD